MDVAALYSNIDHNIGKNCIKKVIEKDLEVLTQQEQFLLKALEFILENNYFFYDNTVYH